MDTNRLSEIEARAKAGEYGTMCKACNDRLLEVVAYIRELEEQIDIMSRERANFDTAHVSGGNKSLG